VVVEPVVALSDVDLGREFRRCNEVIEAIPRDRSAKVASLQAEIARELQRIKDLQGQRAEALNTRRSVKETLTGRDTRTTVIDRQIASSQHWLEQFRDKLAPEESSERTRAQRLREAEPFIARKPVLEAEIARRVKLRVGKAVYDPPEYIARRLGSIPDAGPKREAWLEGAELIERHRLSNAITDPKRALGKDDRSIDHSVATHQLNDMVAEVEPPKRSRGMRM
jgi:hypothetical protein